MFAQTYKRHLTAASYGWNDIYDLAEAEISPNLKLFLDRRDGCDRYEEKQELNETWRFD